MADRLTQLQEAVNQVCDLDLDNDCQTPTDYYYIRLLRQNDKPRRPNTHEK